MSTRPEIIESYKNYSPPIPVVRRVRRMLQVIPPKYLLGLSHILLTNTESLSRGHRRAKTWSRKRKVRIVDACGLYHGKQGNSPAWIEIFVDKTLEGWPRWSLYLPLIGDSPIYDVLYHELGHHIHSSVRREHREREDAADDWKEKLIGVYLRRKFWYLIPILFLLWLLWTTGERIHKQTGRLIRKVTKR